MPTFRSSIYRIIVIIQCFLIMSLVLPGLTAPAIDSKLAIDARQTTTSVNSDQLSRLGNPASLIGHLRFLERESDTPTPSETHPIAVKFIVRHPYLGRLRRRSWLDDATRVFGLGLTDPQHEVSQSINFRTGELTAWRVDIHDTSRAERPLLTIHITPQSLMLSTVVILLLGLVGSRWITRPVESIEESSWLFTTGRPIRLCHPEVTSPTSRGLSKSSRTMSKISMNRGVAQDTLRAFSNR